MNAKRRVVILNLKWRYNNNETIIFLISRLSYISFYDCHFVVIITGYLDIKFLICSLRSTDIPYHFAHGAAIYVVVGADGLQQLLAHRGPLSLTE